MDQVDARLTESWTWTGASTSSSGTPILPVSEWPPFPSTHPQNTPKAQGMLVMGKKLHYRPSAQEAFLSLSRERNFEQANRGWRVAEISILATEIMIAPCALCHRLIPVGSRLYHVVYTPEEKSHLFGPCCANHLPFIRKWIQQQKAL